MLAYASTSHPGVLDSHVLDRMPLSSVNAVQDPHSFAAAGLHPFTEYSCSVQAGSSEGFGDWSSAASVRTTAAVPSAPINLQVQGE